jgi:hypothetical protein
MQDLTNAKPTEKEGQEIEKLRPTPGALTFGEKAVGLTFNPSGYQVVDDCKRMFAACIDQMHTYRSTTESAEVKRLCSVAITELQGAQMWAVKAITWKD